MTYIEKLIKAAEEQDWSVSSDKDYYEFEKHSPAGEDFFFSIQAKNGEEFVREVRDYARDFDPEEHVTQLVIAKNNGFAGVPSIRVLCDDADAVDKMLDELADALEAVEEDEEVNVSLYNSLKRSGYLLYGLTICEETGKLLEFCPISMWETEEQALDALRYEAEVAVVENEDEIEWVDTHAFKKPPFYNLGENQTEVTYIRADDAATDFLPKNVGSLKYGESLALNPVVKPIFNGYFHNTDNFEAGSYFEIRRVGSGSYELDKSLVEMSFEDLSKRQYEFNKEERAIYEEMRALAAKWEEAAKRTATCNRALEYKDRSTEIGHTNNQWQVVEDSPTTKIEICSNLVYSFHVTYFRYSFDTWRVTWSFSLTRQAHAGSDVPILAEQDRQFVTKEGAEKYIAGRKKAYAKYFTELSPAIPKGYAHHFKVGGVLLPGYTVEEDS